MKVLLLGEYSGLFSNLKDGLLELGNEVILVADGDGWKKVQGATFNLNKSSNKHFKTLKDISTYKNYDIVQLINTEILSRKINSIAIAILKKNNGRLVLSSAGDDYFVYKAYQEGKYRYYVYDDYKEIENLYDTRRLLGKVIKYDDINVVKLADAIIPISYEYAEAYRKLKKTQITVPIPINCSKVPYTENLVRNGKVVFFHGINRNTAKGSSYIIAAMKKVKERYPNDVEIIINERMPLNKYLEAMEKTNVVLDQCKGYGWGMNAVYSLAEGKITLSGNEPEALSELGISESPIYNITPNSEQIEQVMEQIIDCKNTITERGFKSREFAEKFHNHVKVAQQYLDIWRTI